MNINRLPIRWVVVASLLAIVMVLKLQHKVLHRAATDVAEAPAPAPRLEDRAASLPSQNTSPVEVPSYARVSARREAVETAEMTSRQTSIKGDMRLDSEFQVSASVQASCRQDALRGYQTSCDKVRHDLSMMAQESRDPAWASDTEAKLQNYFERQNLDGFSVRNIDCRTSTCAIEVAATNGQPIVFVFASPSLLKDQLISPLYFAIGVETEPSGAKLEVLLVTYKRK